MNIADGHPFRVLFSICKANLNNELACFSCYVRYEVRYLKCDAHANYTLRGSRVKLSEFTWLIDFDE